MYSDATTQPLPIFVYGTLLKGQPNDHIWQNSVHSFEAALADNCCLYDFGYYPVMVEKPGCRVIGQLVRLEKDHFLQIIRSLDSLEGFDPDFPHKSCFRRVRMQVSTLAGDKIVAWAYVGDAAQVQSLPLVECGDWAKHVAERDAHILAWRADIRAKIQDMRRPNDSAS